MRDRVLGKELCQLGVGDCCVLFFPGRELHRSQQIQRLEIVGIRTLRFPGQSHRPLQVVFLQIVICQQHARSDCRGSRLGRLLQPGNIFGLLRCRCGDSRHPDHGRDICVVLDENALKALPGSFRIFLQEIQLRQIYGGRGRSRIQCQSLFEALSSISYIVLGKINCAFQVRRYRVLGLFLFQRFRCRERLVELFVLNKTFNQQYVGICHLRV